ncbi:MAG: NnrS family protein [Pigmentiphaga sp.]|nr:NnrS family protein [Pigmentiphaga sp.]
MLEPSSPPKARTNADLPPQWRAFLDMGFRPLYMAGCFWAALSVALWVFAPTVLRGSLNGVIWHAHEMLWGFIATIALGFLLTASATWTGVNPLKGRALGWLCALWLLARLAYLIPGGFFFWFAFVSESLVYLIGAVALGQVIYKTKSKRNYGVPPLVLALGVANGLFLWAVWQGDYPLLMQYFYTGMLCMAVVALLVARRVIPFFAMRAVPGLTIPMHTGSGQVQLAVGCLAILFSLFAWSTGLVPALAAAGGLALWQVLAWKPLAVRRVPLLWILYIGYAGLSAGLLLAAAQISGKEFNWLMRDAWPMHTLGVAGFSVLIIGMVTRTAMGHLGLTLKADRLIMTCYVLLLISAACRLLALVPSSVAVSTSLLHTSATAWVLTFLVYLWRFFPLLIRPRPDQPGLVSGSPGRGVPIKISGK